MFNFISDEVRKLVEDGIGLFISREDMKADQKIPKSNCLDVYIKPEYRFLESSFFEFSPDPKFRDDAYIKNFDLDFPEENRDTLRKVTRHYHPHKEYIIQSQIDKRLRGNKHKRPRNALDDMIDEEERKYMSVCKQ